MKIVALTKKNKILTGEINLPASKSISNRTLIINHVSNNQLELLNLSGSDDTQLMVQLLEKISTTQSAELPVKLNCNNAGTVLRFLTALLSVTPGNWILKGTDRMKERPIGILVDALNQIGADITYLERPGFPPIQIKGKQLKGGKIDIDGSVSSQFVSALLLIAPVFEKGLQLSLTNNISSKPYIEMTLGLLKYFGINFNFMGNEIMIEQHEFKSRKLFIEPDWSAAAYWYEMVAFADEADILLKDLKPGNLSTLTLKSGFAKGCNSLQGDSILPKIYKSFGVKTEILDQGIRLTKKGKSVTEFEFDFTNHPDLAQSIIVTCAGLGIKGTFTGIDSLKIKETDRLKALQTELQKMGFIASTVQGLKFEVRSCLQDEIVYNQSKIVNTYQDHRMAMAFAPLVMVFKQIQIEDPNVVSKSYPGFWEDLNKVKFGTSFSQ